MTANARGRLSGRRRAWLIGPPVALLLAKGLSVFVRVLPPAASLPSGELVVELTLATLAVVAALALLAGRRIGWVIALSIVGWDLVLSLARWWIGSPNYLSLALLALVAVLITSPDVRALYRSSSDGG